MIFKEFAISQIDQRNGSIEFVDIASVNKPENRPRAQGNSAAPPHDSTERDLENQLDINQSAQGECISIERGNYDSDRID